MDELTSACEETLEGWVRAVDLRDREPEGHTRRVTGMTMCLAASVGVPGDHLVHMRRGALLHDIGKLGVPDAVLHKPGRLDPAELEQIRTHPTFACQILAPIGYLKPAIDIPWCHHERWDGGGYPRGLAGTGIPLGARVFAIADVWDALRSDRSYHRGCSRDEARSYIRSNAGMHFDPKLAAAFLDLEAAGVFAEQSPAMAMAG